jgi:hypothetical protein
MDKLIQARWRQGLFSLPAVLSQDSHLNGLKMWHLTHLSDQVRATGATILRGNVPYLGFPRSTFRFVCEQTLSVSVTLASAKDVIPYANVENVRVEDWLSFGEDCFAATERLAGELWRL